FDVEPEASASCMDTLSHILFSLLWSRRENKIFCEMVIFSTRESSSFSNIGIEDRTLPETGSHEICRMHGRDDCELPEPEWTTTQPCIWIAGGAAGSFTFGFRPCMDKVELLS